MNKYQEALEILGYDESEYWEQQRRGLKFIEKYGCCAYEAIQELVDKETPMKVKYLSDDFLSEPYNVKCSYCDYILGKDFIPTNEREKTYHQYCCRCGQKLDWSDSDE